ncbi:hypothetical protein BTVI_142747 [Pitangus sulphuratus]|nr:hypothetical protein BTVI_142747 [Pitangus sulphuratus]
MRMVKCLEEKPCKEQLRILGLFILGKRRLRGDLIVIFTILTRGSGAAGVQPAMYCSVKQRALVFRHLDNTPKHVVLFLECPVQGQELDSMILMHPFQLSVFCDS